VRELRNAIEHAVVLADRGTIEVDHLPETFRRADQKSSPDATGSIRDRVENLEKQSLELALASEHGNQTRAARRLGLSRRALIYKMEKYGLKKRSE
jgi:DNA-binding NtrC family response regulator